MEPVLEAYAQPVRLTSGIADLTLFRRGDHYFGQLAGWHIAGGAPPSAKDAVEAAPTSNRARSVNGRYFSLSVSFAVDLQARGATLGGLQGKMRKCSKSERSRETKQFARFREVRKIFRTVGVPLKTKPLTLTKWRR